MPVRRLPPVVIRRRFFKKQRPVLPAGRMPTIARVEAEVLGGTVQGMPASAPEERLARALDKIDAVENYQFRYTVGAPRGLPGWKELDFLVFARGIAFAIEVDSEFTHRDKAGRGDVLHDAIVLNDLSQQGIPVYPTVIHLKMESELVDQTWADRTAEGLFL